MIIIIIIIIIIVIIIIIIIFDGDTFYWVNLSSLHPFEVYTKCDKCNYKVRRFFRCFRRIKPVLWAQDTRLSSGQLWQNSTTSFRQ